MTTKNRGSAIVYSTGHGKMCPACGKPEAQCICCRNSASPPGDGIVRVGRATKGCRGKVLTVITGVFLDHDGLINLARQLKQKCGAGGTVKDGVVEIQGDHRELLVEELKKREYAVKHSGS